MTSPAQRRLALAVLTAVGLWLCYKLTEPFLSGLAWAVALAVMGWALHRRLTRYVSDSRAAMLSTIVILLVIALPVLLVSLQLGLEGQKVSQVVHEYITGDRWREEVRRLPYVGEQLAGTDLTRQAQALAQKATGYTGAVANSLGDFVLQALVATFALYYFLKDRDNLLKQIRKLLPVDHDRAEQIFKRSADAIHATVYGTLLCGAIQGITGGLVFWAVGLPAPILWGAVVFVLGILPFVGGFLVWVPAAIWLATQDRWAAAAIITAWGIGMATVNNYIYAVLAGDRLKLHAIPTLIAFIGGIAVFGVSGMVLGPCILAITLALVDAWRFDQPQALPAAA